MANADSLISRSPSTTTLFSFTRTRSETRMWPKCMPKGLTQKWSWSSGSRGVICPATPSLNQNFAKSRKAEASRCLRCRRSSATVAKEGGSGVFAILTSVGRTVPGMDNLSLTRAPSCCLSGEGRDNAGRYSSYGRVCQRTRIQSSGRFCVQIDRGIRVSTENGSRAIRGYRLLDNPPDNLGFAATGHRRNDLLHPKKRGHSEGNGRLRNIFETLEPAFGYLLLPGNTIQLNDFYLEWIVKVRLGRIVECQMAIFPDPRQAQLRFCGTQLFRIVPAAKLRVGRIAIDPEELF